jgi:hypothetical protein
VASNKLEDIYEESPEQKILIFRKHGAFAYFGEEDIIKVKNRSCNAVCIEDCELYTLDKNEIENIIRAEYPLIYSNILDIVTKKELTDYENKKALVNIFQQFTEIDYDKIANTLTVQDIKNPDEIPTLQDLYEESIVKHPIEVLLNTFTSKNDQEEMLNNSDLPIDELTKPDIKELYKMLQDTIESKNVDLFDHNLELQDIKQKEQEDRNEKESLGHVAPEIYINEVNFPSVKRTRRSSHQLASAPISPYTHTPQQPLVSHGFSNHLKIGLAVLEGHGLQSQKNIHRESRSGSVIKSSQSHTPKDARTPKERTPRGKNEHTSIQITPNNKTDPS